MAVKGGAPDLKAELESFKALRAELQQTHAARQQMTLQEQENQMVLRELEQLEEGARVFKLVGPALVPQDLAEASATVAKRLEFITGELGRLDGLARGQEEKALATQQRCMKLESAAQRRQEGGKG